MVKVFLVLCCATVVQAFSATIKTTLGPLTGNYNADADTGEFKGIPYANPVVRFTVPTPVDVPLPPMATEYGSACISASQGGAEECHFVNVVAPSDPAAAGSSNRARYVPAAPGTFPILVFVHGGSFIEGAGSDYNATYLASRHKAVVVTINYRLGSFGWAQPIKGRANFGLYDQQEALRFLRRTGTDDTPFIENFGGDVTRLLLFGESAGAISVATHLISPSSAGLFTSALVESGFLTASSQDYALARGNNFTKAAGCSTTGTDAERIACLQAASLKTILKAEGDLSPVGSDPFLVAAWGPTVDGPSGNVPDYPMKLLGEGNVIPGVNIAAGSNTDEGWLFVYPEYPVLPMNAKEYTKFVTEYIANSAHGTNVPLNSSVVDAVLEVYPPKTGVLADNRPTAANILADSTFVCGARTVVQGMEQAYKKNAPTHHRESFYLYHFAHKTAGLTIHGSELPFVFDTGSGTPAKQRLAQAMGGFWSSFAASGNPNAGAAVDWPAYNITTDKNIILDTPNANGGKKFATETHRRKKYCDFWMSLQP